MAGNKTTATDASVQAFLDKIPEEDRRRDAYAILEIMEQVSRKPPKMWGTAIVGFDVLHYHYESGRSGEICKIGFSPRKDQFALYLCGGLAPLQPLLDKLGKYKTGKGCLYIKKIKDIDPVVLRQLIGKAYSSKNT